MSVRVVPWKPEQGANKWRVDIRFKKPDGTKVRNQTVYEAPSLRMAERWGEAREAQMRTGTLVLDKVQSPTFSVYADEWMEVYPKAAGNRHTTVAEKKTHLEHHLKPFFGSVTIDKIDKPLMEKFIAVSLDKTKGKDPKERTRKVGTGRKALSPKTVRNMMMTLRRVLASAKEAKKLLLMPEMPRVKVTLGGFDFYDVEEAALLIGSAGDSAERAMLSFALKTGARAGELLAIEWTSIDTRHKIVSFSRSTTKGVTVSTTKGGKPRRVPLSPALEADLKAIKHLKGPLVFCKADGSAYNLDDLHRLLKRAQRRAVLRQLRWHDLRHSYASNLVASGTPLNQVMMWMGHSTIQMTMRYAHLSPNERDAAKYVNALDCAPASKRDAAAE
jgi:integrase